jgi:hypothetical protein
VTLGSYEEWCAWCRDPLLTLGCRDPVERIATAKANDPHRQFVREVFNTWWEAHGSVPTKASKLSDRVTALLDPQGRGRQYLATRLVGLVDTRAAGFVLTRQEPAGTWGAATYALIKSDSPDAIGHRGHRTDRAGGPATAGPMGPMSPMPDAVEDAPKWEIEL